MVRRLVGGDDVEPSVLEWQAGRIRGQEEDVSSIARRGARQRDLLRVDVDAYRAYAERIGDEQRRGAVAAADVQYDQLRWTGTWRRRRTASSATLRLCPMSLTKRFSILVIRMALLPGKSMAPASTVCV